MSGFFGGGSSPKGIEKIVEDIISGNIEEYVDDFFDENIGVVGPVPNFNNQIFNTNYISGAILGDIVYISGNPTPDGYLSVGLCDITDSNKIPAVGVIIAINSPTIMQVQSTGLITNIYTNLTPGKNLYLGPGGGGRLVQAPVNNPDSGIKFIQSVGIAVTQSSILLNFTNPTKLISI